jgi:dienelactone hydrolase
MKISINLISNYLMLKNLFVIIVSCALIGCSATMGPSGDQTRPGVIVLPTSGGVHHENSYASQLSRKGFQVVVADYHQRGGTDNITLAYDALRKDPRVGKIGMVGFSRGAVMGANHAYFLHQNSDRKIDAIVSFYIGPTTPHSNTSILPILFLQGELDNYVKPNQLIQFCNALDASGKRCKVKEFKNVGHAFDQMKTLPIYSGFNREATEESYDLTIQWLNQWLK